MIPPESDCLGIRPDPIDCKFVAENCADVLCSIAPDHLIHYISPSCTEILGWLPAEMVAKDLRHFIFSDDLPAFDRLESGKSPDGKNYAHARVRIRRKDQTPVWISINARCVRDSLTGEPRQYVLSMRDITGRSALEEKLSNLAMTDALTGLWNRRAFDQALRREWRRALRDKSQVSLLLLDLDHFKMLNDRHGHVLGDKLLETVASTISNAVRTSDLVCRWGGDEIAIILPATDSVGALQVAEKVRAAIEVLRIPSTGHSNESMSVTASIGVATAEENTAKPAVVSQALLRAADRALYRAKHEGHNRVANVLASLPINTTGAFPKESGWAALGKGRLAAPTVSDSQICE